MKYDDIIELAREQDPGPHPGPDFMALMSASAPPRPRRWPRVVVGVAVAVAASVLLWSRIDSVSISPATSPEPSQAVQHSSSPPETTEAVNRSRRGLGDPTDRAESPEPSDTPEGIEPAGTTPESVKHESGAPESAAPEPAARTAETKRSRPSLDADTLYRRAEDHMAAGRLDAARDDLRRVVRRFPDYGQRAAAWIDWARVEERLGHPQRAACEYAAFLRRFSGHALASDARKARSRVLEDPDVEDARCR